MIPETPLQHFKRMWYDQDIDWIEAGVGLAFILRGYWMLQFDQLTLPVSVHEYLVPSGLSINGWGIVLIALGLSQMSISFFFWRHTILRAIAATCGAALQGIAAYSYFKSGDYWLGVVPMILCIILAEMFVAYRAWSVLSSRLKRLWRGR